MDCETEVIEQCHICGEPALMYCTDCDNYYCENCEGKTSIFYDYGTCAKCAEKEPES